MSIWLWIIGVFHWSVTVVNTFSHVRTCIFTRTQKAQRNCLIFNVISQRTLRFCGEVQFFIQSKCKLKRSEQVLPCLSRATPFASIRLGLRLVKRFTTWYVWLTFKNMCRARHTTKAWRWTGKASGFFFFLRSPSKSHLFYSLQGCSNLFPAPHTSHCDYLLSYSAGK